MIFEVGRTDAFRLKTETDLQKDQQLCGSLIFVLNRDSTPRPSLHPDLDASGQTTSLTGAAAVPALALLFLAVVCLVCERGWHVGRDASLQVRAAVGALFGLVTIAALLLCRTIVPYCRCNEHGDLVHKENPGRLWRLV